MNNLQEMLRAAGQHMAGGRIGDAEAIYRQALAANPSNPQVLMLLGALLMQADRAEEAATVLAAAARACPDRPEPLHGQALALRRAGRPVEAIDVIQSALRIAPNWPDLANNLAAAHEEAGHLDEAEQTYRKLLAANPNEGAAHNNLGRLRARRGDFEGAIAEYRAAISLLPKSPMPYNNLGNALRRVRRLSEAEAALRTAIHMAPQYAEAHTNLGVVYKDMGRLAEAEACHRRSLSLRPDTVEGLGNLGLVLVEMGRVGEARAAYERALQLRPDSAMIHNNLALLEKSAGRISEMVARLRRAVELDPNYHGAALNLANALHSSAQPGEAVAIYRRLVDADPNDAAAHSNLLMSLNYLDDPDPAAIFAAHARFGERFDRPSPDAPTNDRSPERRLRVGYVSADFWTHPVPQFAESMLAGHDRANVEVFCYSSVRRPDARTQRLRGFADQWRDVAAMSDAELFALIRRDQIDILVDLGGHTDGNRLPLFGTKPAPVQVTYLGYPNTTGLRTMDYRMTDAIADPPGEADAWHTEKLVRLPGCFLCFNGPIDAPDVAPLPAERGCPFTFGSFNNFTKVTQETIALWARILVAVPESRLLLKAKFLGDAALVRLVHDSFASHGVASERLDVRDVEGDFARHLACYHEVDLGLDPFPYNGTTTTCEALWMGAPTVTLAGRAHVSRVGASLMAVVGLSDFVAQTPDECVQIAAKLAADRGRLAKIRGDLRQRMRASSLMDRVGFITSLENAYRTMWRRWCGVAA